MLIEIMRHIKNFFSIGCETGDFEIKSGSIAVENEYVVGQFVAISGSFLNDGVKRVESFEDGVISFTIRSEEYPQWVQPAGAHDAFKIGDRVTHNGERWISLINANVYVPGSDARWWERLHDSPEEHSTVDETFTGTIYSLRVPPDFLRLADEIGTFTDSRDGQASNITSASFGIQSYSWATDANGLRAGWETVFSKRLNQYRRYTKDIDI